MPQTCVSATRVIAMVAVTVAALSACSSPVLLPAPSSPGPVAITPAPTDTPVPTATPSQAPSPTPAPPMPTPIAGAPDSGVALQLTASGHGWDVKNLAGPAGKAFKIAVTNQDKDQHNLVISSGTDVASRLATLDKFAGPATKTLDVPGLPAGTYLFRCTLHDSMKGELTIK